MLSGGKIRLVTVAPEMDGAVDFIHALKDEVVISAGHTDADTGTSAEAFAAGIRHVTHLYNAMRGMSHRDPGPVFAAADREDVNVELICDGIHVDPIVVRQTFKLFGEDRIVFISDSTAATGMPDGDYSLGGLSVRKQGRRAQLADGTIAGSASTLMDCMRTAVLEMGIPLAAAVRCASVNPARAVGLYDRFGSIDVGKSADLVLLDKDLNVIRVIARGKCIQ